jgi:hypothetical protein
MNNGDVMAEKGSRYYAYLLRLWQNGDEEKVWRASLESPKTRERRGFASLEDLFGYLRACITPQEARDFGHEKIMDDKE